MARTPKPISSVIYRGPSLLDGAPIVVIAIVSSKNSKTGDMVQTYILRDDMDPRDANRSGADYSICGNCPLRGIAGAVTHAKGEILAKGRACYVRIDQGPLTVYRGLSRGLYPDAMTREARAAIGRGRMVRVGAYGDGAAVPFSVWNDITSDAAGHTAYSHQAGIDSADYRPSFYMRSVQSLAEAQAAWQNGERTFRVVASETDAVKGQEIICPSPRVSCKDCGLCAGNAKRAKSIAIPVHGIGAGNLNLAA